MLAQDDQINRVILAKLLTLDGHTIVSTTNGQECVETVHADREFDCILMDIQSVFLSLECVRLSGLHTYIYIGCRC